jgi:hydrogenase maturation factor HypF (carbamoyltransferase family)
MSTELYLNIGLRRAAKGGKNRCHFASELDGDIIRTKPLFEQLYGYGLTAKGPKALSEAQKADLCFGFVDEVVRLMAEKAQEHRGKVGLSGGVAYSLPLIAMLRRHVGQGLVMHDRVPPGDGGISIGQNAVVGYSQK